MLALRSIGLRLVMRSTGSVSDLNSDQKIYWSKLRSLTLPVCAYSEKNQLLRRHHKPRDVITQCLIFPPEGGHSSRGGLNVRTVRTRSVYLAIRTRSRRL